MSRWCSPMRGLVEDVQHAHQPRADLRRETDALRLAPREAPGGAAEGEVLEPHVAQEPQPVADLLEDRAGHLGVEPRPSLPPQLEAFDVRQGVRHRHRDEVADAAAPDQHGQALPLEAPPLAGRAGPFRHVLAQLLAHRVGGGLLVAPLDVAEDPLPPRLVLAAELLRLVLEVELLPLDAVEERLAHAGRQPPPRRVEVELQLLGERGRDDLPQVAAQARPRQDHALEDGDVLAAEGERLR